jgi:trk system potassium uptake protein TrkH
MFKNKKIILIPIIGFILLILVGSILLYLPISNKGPISFLDAIFISTSSVCTTGFSTVNLLEQFTLFGQVIILLITQIGALGIIIFVAFLFIILNKKIQFSQLVFFSENVNNNNYSLFKNKIVQIIKYTFIIEGLGAWLLSFKFIPMMNLGQGLWYSIFHSVMAFCNAGLDLFGTNGLSMFYGDTYTCIVFTILIFCGGLGFFVLEDIIAAILHGSFKKITFQTKIVLSATTIVLVSSVILFKILEPQMTFIEALFNSVTLRTAGFYIKDFANYSLETQVLAMFLMFIGAAPASTSGGIKLVTLAIIFLTIKASISGKDTVVVFFRKIGDKTIKTAYTILVLSLLVILIAIILYAKFDNFGLEKIMFHAISAFSDTGLGIYNSSDLNFAGKLITIALMFLGRLRSSIFLYINNYFT